MNVFELQKRVIDQYHQYVESFLNIRDKEISNFVHKELSRGILWPDALVQLNPAYEMGKRVADLVDARMLHPLCERIFRKANGESFHLYKHQEEAIYTAAKKEPYVLTTGTGSGKSLTYLIPIMDHILKHDPQPKRVRAVIVYPMNALINSQETAIRNMLNNLGEGQDIIRFGRYTGQEDQNRRAELQQNPPHILLTNYVMLELMMSRPHERIFLDNTLANLEFLVLDELHTYSGRRGADVSMLVRRVRQRCGNDDLICIGTSATMASGASREEEKRAVAQVTSKLFGVSIKVENVIDEKLKPSISYSGELTQQSIKNALNKDTPAAYAEFIINPFAAWIEKTFGIEQREGYYKRRRPITLSQGAEQLSELTGFDPQTCQQKIKLFLHQGSDLHHEDGSAVFPLKLHQFISQGDTVYATLESSEKREFTMTGQVYAEAEQGNDRLFIPMVFCRECGQEYYQASLGQNDKIEPRMWYEEADAMSMNKTNGYILIDDGGEPIWNDERLGELPDNWFRETKNGRQIVSRYKDFLPWKMYVSSDGSVYDDPHEHALPCWFLQMPLLICPSCGVVYDKRTSEFRKLSRLSSEGRSTATTLLTLTTVNELMHAKEVDRDARKILSFTDNRQDASLQAGHFNDFVQVGLLRNAIYRSLPKTGHLRHQDIASEVVKAVNLPPEVYARNPGQIGVQPRINQGALTAFIEYNLYCDLRRGWRIVQPNLEQCGLLKMEYEGLKEVCEADSYWQENPILAQAPGAMRFEVANALLDHLRKSLALDAYCLRAESQIRLKREVNATLKDLWVFDANERLVESEWFRYGKEIEGRLSLAATGLLGRYLRSRRAWQFLERPLNQEQYEKLLRAFVKILTDGGYLKFEEAGDNFRIQLSVVTLQWKKGEGTAPPDDPVRMVHLKSDDKFPKGKKTNLFFTKFYKETAASLYAYEGRKHTGQTSRDDRIDREERFRAGDLSTLFCSPTMELGIDISDLVAVNMRNVPPSPANYAQRSGRAGRAGQPAFVSTYCSTGSGHDQYYFRKRPDMVSGIVAPPRLELSNQELIESHMHVVWLAEVNINLTNSIAEILDLNQHNLPLNDNFQHQIYLSENRLRSCFETCKKILKQCESDLVHSMWYSEEWLTAILKRAPEDFDRAFDRWRELYRSADKQLAEAQLKIREAPQRGLSREEKRKAERAEREAQHQKELLCNQGKSFEDTDFYPYRYLAGEGFLPGYNFPRLPIRAYVPTEKHGIFLSRNRFLALSEYGPRNIIYHEGRKYRVVQSMLPPGDEESRFTRTKLCNTCGAFHSAENINSDACVQCGSLLDGNNAEYFDHLFEMTSVSTQPWERINCNEEERLRKGFFITTHFNFSKAEGKEQKICSQIIDANGNPILDLVYGSAAQLWRINRGWRKREARGFTLDLAQGIWDKQEDDHEDTALDAGKERIISQVYPFVRDTRNILLLKPSANIALGEIALTNLQYALHNGICIELNVSEDEITSERIGTKEHRSVLFWEAAEGGVGVLQRLVIEPDSIGKIANRALEICHFNAVTGENESQECVKACYNCLLSYRNQIDHKILDRHLIRNPLLTLVKCVSQQGHASRTYKEHYEWLRSQTDSRSKLEKDFLDYLFRHGRRLPDEAQKYLAQFGCCPDFFYKDGYVCVFCDGSVHDDPRQQAEDKKIRSVLKAAGLRIIVIRYDESLDQQIEKHGDVFGVVMQ